VGSNPTLTASLLKLKYLLALPDIRLASKCLRARKGPWAATQPSLLVQLPALEQ
jgi:hypothetical protein